MTERLLALLLESAAGRIGSVTSLCAEVGISRQTFYKYKRRFALEGMDGLRARSRRPRSSPTMTSPAVVEVIVRTRKTLEEEGWDNGALSVYYRMLADAGAAAPSVRTVHRVLVREGLIVPERSKRPRSALKRFRFPATDDCWQIDGFDHVLADGQRVCVFQILDDHSRYEVGNLVWPAEDTAGAWTAITTAMGRHGMPRMVLSDNGLAFTGRRMNMKVSFETNLALAGIKLINSRPLHPQTCGKNERLHKTVRKWLTKQPRATTIAQLQAQLDDYRNKYNTERPHQALGGQTPHQARQAGIRWDPQPTIGPNQPATIVINTELDFRGQIQYRRKRLRLGPHNARTPITIFDTDGHVRILNQHGLLADYLLPDIHSKPTDPPPVG